MAAQALPCKFFRVARPGCGVYRGASCTSAVPALKTARQLVEDALDQVTSLSVPQLQQRLGAPGLKLVDLREPDERLRHGSIPGALHVPRGLLEFKADPASPWADPALAAPGPWVLFCGVGWRSALAALALQEMGFSDVAHLDGGFTAWRDAGGAVELDRVIPDAKTAV